ncbi:MAG: hypothetical protein NVSMB27_05420 [Ktedonobacteraceae bacterium]
MHTILITINGPRRSVDLEIPGEIPISELIPALLEICGPQPLQLTQPTSFLWASWGVRPIEGTQTFAPNRSLIEAGVLDGAVLVLQNIDARTKPGEYKAAFAPQTIEQRHPEDIGVRWGEGLLS